MPANLKNYKLNQVGAVLCTALAADQLVSDTKAQEILEFHTLLAAEQDAVCCVPLGLEHVLCFQRADQAFAAARVLKVAFPHMRMSLHLGEVRYAQEDVYGPTVEGSLWLRDRAKAGEIVASSAILNQLPTDSLQATCLDGYQDAYVVVPSEQILQAHPSFDTTKLRAS